MIAAALVLLACSSDGTTSTGSLEAPRDLVAKRGPRYVDLSWTGSAGAQSYVVEVDRGSSFAQLATSTTASVRIDANETSFSSLDEYTLRVRAIGAAARKSDPSGTVVTAPCDEPFCVDARTNPNLTDITIAKLGTNVVALGRAANGNVGAVRTSDGGKTWPASTVADLKPTVGGAYRWAVARGVALFARGGELLRTSDDGATFTVVDLPSAPAGSNDSVWDDGTSFQVVRISGSARTLWTSPDGTTWTSTACPNCAEHVSVGAGSLVGLGYEGISTGKQWVRTAPIANPTQWTNAFQLGVTNTPGGETLGTATAAFAWSVTLPRVVRSSDAITFADVPKLPANASVFSDGTAFAAYVGVGGTHFASTDDGKTFDAIAVDGGVTRWIALGDRYAVVAEGKMLYGAARAVW